MIGGRRALTAALLLSGCASNRLLRLENQVLEARVEALEAHTRELEERLPALDAWVRDPQLADVEKFLTRSGYAFRREPERERLVVPFHGRNTDFDVSIQLFGPQKVLFLATDDYLDLGEAHTPESIVLLLVQLAAINFDLLVGKFQLDPQSGDVLLSTELHTTDGLGYATFVQAFEGLCHQADTRHPDLVRALQGPGL